MCTSYSNPTPFSSCYTFLRNPSQLTSKDLDDVATVNQESCNSVHLFPAVLWKCICKRGIFPFQMGWPRRLPQGDLDLEDLRQR